MYILLQMIRAYYRVFSVTAADVTAETLFVSTAQQLMNILKTAKNFPLYFLRIMKLMTKTATKMMTVMMTVIKTRMKTRTVFRTMMI